MKPTLRDDGEIHILQEKERVPCELCGCHVLKIIKEGEHCSFCKPPTSTLRDEIQQQESRVIPFEELIPILYQIAVDCDDEGYAAMLQAIDVVYRHEEVIDEVMEIVDKAIKHGTLPEPNPYGNMVRVKRHNQVVREMEEIILSALSKLKDK